MCGLFSKTLAACSLLSAFLKDEERLIVNWVEGGGGSTPRDGVRELYAEALPIGEVRGYVHTTPSLAQWDGRLHQGGLLSVSRILYGHLQPARSTVCTVNGDVVSELESFYARSEQRGAVVALGADVEEGGRVVHCGGVIVEAIGREGGKGLDGGEEEEEGGGVGGVKDSPALSSVRNKLQGQALYKHHHPNELRQAAAALIPGLDLTQPRVPVDFFCRCTTGGFLAKLVESCSYETLQQFLLEAQGGVAATLQCHFCNKSHAIRQGDLLASLNAKYK